jgi:hypothetical protein
LAKKAPARQPAAGWTGGAGGSGVSGSRTASARSCRPASAARGPPSAAVSPAASEEIRIAVHHDVRDPAAVEVFQRSAGREPGHSNPSFAAVGLAGGDFALQAGGQVGGGAAVRGVISQAAVAMCQAGTSMRPPSGSR